MNEPKKLPRNDALPSDDARMQKHLALSKALNEMHQTTCDPDQVSGKWSKFGHMPTNPIHALSRRDAIRYLARLRLADGQEVLYRQARMLALNFSLSPIECFEITRLDGAPLATLYVALDSNRRSGDAPEGFLLESQNLH